MSDATAQQPAPTPASGDVWLAVIADMHARREFGIAKYGGPVQALNGRKSLVDLFQELLDATVYAKAAIIEGELAQAALDVMMRRRWYAVPMSGDRWYVVAEFASKYEFDFWGNADLYCASPFTALVEADAWYKANIEVEQRP